MAPPALSDKIRGRHRDRLAVVYVRQSTLQQVGRHPESTRLQYALAERAQRLGWARERVVVIDDDLGRSPVNGRACPAADLGSEEPPKLGSQANPGPSPPLADLLRESWGWVDS